MNQPLPIHGATFEPGFIGPEYRAPALTDAQCDELIADVSKAIETEKSHRAERIKAALEIAKGEL